MTSITYALLFDLISEKIAMTGHRIKVPNVTKNKKTGEVEFHAPRKKLPPHVKAIKAKKRSFRKGKRV